MKELIFSAMLLFGCSSLEAAQSKQQVRTAQLPPGAKVRTAQQDAELKDWIIGIQKLAEDAQKDADNAEKEAAQVRAELTEANNNADTLQGAINAQADQLNKSLAETKKAQDHDAKVTKENNLLKNILGIEAALIAIFICLWLRVPALSPPTGLIVTCAAPLVIFGLVKLIL